MIIIYNHSKVYHINFILDTIGSKYLKSFSAILYDDDPTNVREVFNGTHYSAKLINPEKGIKKLDLS